jgi:hypothetical protein
MQVEHRQAMAAQPGFKLKYLLSIAGNWPSDGPVK